MADLRPSQRRARREAPGLRERAARARDRAEGPFEGPSGWGLRWAGVSLAEPDAAEFERRLNDSVPECPEVRRAAQRDACGYMLADEIIDRHDLERLDRCAAGPVARDLRTLDEGVHR